MIETLTVRPELFVLAADDVALWMLTAGPLLGDPVPADSTVEAEVNTTLRRAGFDPEHVTLRHGTSWRQDGPALILTHVIILPVVQHRVDAFALDLSPDAAPISRQLFDHWGPPPPHPANAYPPAVRTADVLQHALRHLAFLLDTDASAAAALDGLGDPDDDGQRGRWHDCRECGFAVEGFGTWQLAIAHQRETGHGVLHGADDRPTPDGGHWRRHLAPLQPALAQMYR